MDRAAAKRSRKIKDKENRPVLISTEIIEISSDEEEVSIPPKRKDRPEEKIAALQKDVARLEKEVQSATKELEDVTNILEEASNREKFINEIENQICCDICSETMWKPWILHCGHSLCEDCLDSWFNQTLSQHMASNPHYTEYLHRYYLTSYNLLKQHGPRYSCPTCRKEVKGKPTEEYFLKALVHTIAASKGKKHDGDKGPRTVPWAKYFAEGKYFA
ncbi:hypothetical protein GYMLUDRAFT_35784 [Collybiopsis luxurians FD-317 M1]|nr:hypothetical protein GYMLUDRAFT_35784 [Collybiopsis luxurians FD-317 M1]